VEELRTDVVNGKSQVIMADVEAMVLALGHIGRSLASLRGELLHLIGSFCCCYFTQSANQNSDVS